MRIALAFAAAVLLAGCDFEDFGPSDRYRSAFHYSYDLEPNGRVSLDNFNGQIDVTGWEQNKVEIDGEKYASTEELRDAIKIEIHNSPSSLDVRTVRPSMP